MKFIHCADLHLNSRIDTLPTEKAKIRREEILRSFEKLCEYAKVENITAVILAGDIFDTPYNSRKIKERFLYAISSAENVDFLFLNGNHDEGKLFDENDSIPDNLKFFSDDWTSYNYGNVCISGINFSSDNYLFVYDSLKLDKDKINIVTMHGQIAAYNKADGFYIVNLKKLQDKNIDYLALGHVHAFSSGELDKRGKYAYSGALDGRGFDELGDKGFILLHESEGKLTESFVKFSSRILYEYTFNVEDYPDFNALKYGVVDELRKGAAENSLIKIILKGERPIDYYIDVNSFTSLLNEYFFFAKIYDRTELKINADDFSLDKSIRGEFVRAVIDSDLNDEMKKKVIMCGINALKGEELL